jgi:hypothetical protein
MIVPGGMERFVIMRQLRMWPNEIYMQFFRNIFRNFSVLIRFLAGEKSDKGRVVGDSF